VVRRGSPLRALRLRGEGARVVKEPPFANLPRGFETWNPAMRGAYLKGRRARRDDDPIDACPYRDIRNARGTLTWSRAFERAWVDGWRDEAGSSLPAVP
jgi:hypothetical protein